MSKRAEKAALKAYPVNMQYSTVYDCVYDLAQIERKKFLKVYEQAEKDILSIIQSRLEEIPGDAQPRPILRAELQELMIKIMEEDK